VAANDTTALAVITQTQPISVAFTLPENSLETVLARYRSGAKLPAEAWDRGDVKPRPPACCTASTTRSTSPPAP
jgi:multidrug efflux system membrane fusion protein